MNVGADCFILFKLSTLIMFILFIEMYLGCIYDACIQMLYKRDTKGDAYAKLLNVPMYIHFSELKKKMSTSISFNWTKMYFGKKQQINCCF